MEGYITLLYIIGLVWAVLNIILFFKIWGMTDNVKESKEILLDIFYLLSSKEESSQNEISKESCPIKEGDVVINKKNGNEMIVKTIYSDGTLGCETGKMYLEDFSIDDVEIKKK